MAILPQWDLTDARRTSEPEVALIPCPGLGLRETDERRRADSEESSKSSSEYSHDGAGVELCSPWPSDHTA